MIEFESGGFEGAKPAKSSANRLPTQSIVAPVNAPADAQENLWGYAKRNASKIPALIYEQIRTGLGLGDVIHKFEPPEQQIQGMRRKPTSIFDVFASPEQANEEAYSILTKFGAKPETAKYMTEHRPEDWPTEMFVQELPWLASGLWAAKKAGSIAPLLHYGLQTGAALGGGYGLGEAAKQLGQPLGLGEQMAALGGLAGTTIGGAGAGAAARKYNMGEEYRRKAFEEAQQQRKALARTTFITKQADIHTATDAEIMKIAQERETAHKQATETRQEAHGQAAEQRENAQTKAGENREDALYANEQTLVKNLEETEATKNQVLTEAERDLPQEVQRLIIEERTKKQAIPGTVDAHNKDKAARIDNVNERIDAYGNEQQKLHQIVEENAKKQDALPGTEVGNGTQLTKNAVEAVKKENLELLEPKDANKVKRFARAIVEKVNSKKGLTVKQAKRWYKKANSIIFNPHADPVLKGVLIDILHKEGGLHDYITQTGSPEHTKAWIEMNDAYSRGKILKAGRKDFIADQRAEIAAIRGERLDEMTKFNLQQEATEATAERKSTEKVYKDIKSKAESTATGKRGQAEREHKRETKRIEDAYKKALERAENAEATSKRRAQEAEAKAKNKALVTETEAKETAQQNKQKTLNQAEEDHNIAQTAIGENTYEKFMNDLEKADRSEHNIINKILDFSTHGMSRYTTAALGLFFGGAKFGTAGGALLGAAGHLASTAAREIRMTRRVLIDHPNLYKEMMATVNKAKKWDAAHALVQFNRLGNKIERYAEDYKEEAQPTGLEFEAGGYG